MKILFEGAIILAVYFLGIFISDIVRSVVFIPGNIIGMGLLFLLLNLGVVKISCIEKVSGFMLKNMGFFFIPLSVGIYVLFDIIRPVWIEITIILILSNIFVLFVTGKIVQIFIEKTKKERNI
jgi:holin-like protein